MSWCVYLPETEGHGHVHALALSLCCVPAKVRPGPGNAGMAVAGARLPTCAGAASTCSTAWQQMRVQTVTALWRGSGYLPGTAC
jgi:hypothetical protein